MKHAITAALTMIRRFPFQALAVISLVSLTFYLAYAMSFLSIGGNTVVSYFERQPMVIAFFEIDAPQSDIDAALEKVQQESYVERAVVVSKQEALEIYRKENQDDALLLELVTADILPASIQVSTTDLAELPRVKDLLDKQEGIEDVVFQKDLTESLGRWTFMIRVVGVEILSVLAGISFAVIFISIALKATTQKKSIDIMVLLGASRGFIKAPFMLEGIIYGIFGAVVGWVLVMGRILYVLPAIDEFFSGIFPQPIPWQIFAYHLGAGLAAGIFIGGLAGLLAVNRLIKR